MIIVIVALAGFWPRGLHNVIFITLKICQGAPFNYWLYTGVFKLEKKNSKLKEFLSNFE